MKTFLGFCMFVFSINALADYKVANTDLGALNFDFLAPIVASDSDVPAQAGLIYYDIGVGLKIINPLGDIELISATDGAP